MLRIGFDHVLRYLATGDDEALVLDALRVQADAAEVLAQARAALEMLSPAGLGPAAAARLRKAEGEAGGPQTNPTLPAKPPPKPLPPKVAAERTLARQSLGRAMAAREFPAPTRSAGPRRAMRGGLDVARPRPPPGLGAAIRAGMQQAVRLGTAVLFKPFVKRDRDGPGGLRAVMDWERAPSPPTLDDARSESRAAPPINEEDLVTAAARDGERLYAEDDALDGPGDDEVSLDLADVSEPPDDATVIRSGARFDTPRGATVELSCQTDAGGDWLRVVLSGGDATTRPLLVTCVPATGPVARATTDAAGVALLPWPAEGRGVLRIDGDRTVEIALKVQL